MIYTLREFERYSIAASDGPIGSVKDVFFNDHSLRVCYFVVETGSWLNSRRVWLAAHRLTPVPSAQWLTIDATREAVRSSPDVSTHLPVSREHRRALADYFRSRSGSGSSVLHQGSGETPNDQRCEDAEEGCLRSVREARGYKVVARDGAVGEVQDFLAEVPRWTLRYFLVDTGKWLVHRSVLVAPEWIGRVRWDEETVAVDLPREEVLEGPPYDPGAPVTAEYTDRLVREFGPKPAPETAELCTPRAR